MLNLHGGNNRYQISNVCLLNVWDVLMTAQLYKVNNIHRNIDAAHHIYIICLIFLGYIYE